MLKLAQRAHQTAREVIAKCDHIDFNAKKFALLHFHSELTQIIGCSHGEKEWWRRVGFEANCEDTRGIIKVEFGKYDAARIRFKRAEFKHASDWGERMKRAGHVDMLPELNMVKHVVAQLAGIAASVRLLYHFERDVEKGLRNLHNLVQVEIKSLRTCGYKEKDLIPTALYRRAFETLTERKCSVAVYGRLSALSPFGQTPKSSVASKQEPC